VPCCSSDRAKLHSHDSPMPARVAAEKSLCLLGQSALQSPTQTKKIRHCRYSAAQERVYDPRPTRRPRVLIRLPALQDCVFRRLALETTLASTCRDMPRGDVAARYPRIKNSLRLAPPALGHDYESTRVSVSRVLISGAIGASSSMRATASRA
jgi:hypothetical protein